MSNQCIVCASKEVIVTARGAVKLYRCATCGVHWNYEHRESSVLSEYYKSTYSLKRSDEDKENLTAERRRIARLPEQLSLIADICRYEQPPASLIDLGCDRGYFLDEARRFGFSVTGVELSQRGRDACKAIGISCYESIEQVPIQSFDIATLHHVLEHLPDPVEELSKLSARLKHGGILLVRVPDFSSFWSRVFGGKWIWFQPKNHCIHFSKQSLKIAIEHAGFELISLVSRKPNSLLTSRAFSVARRSFSRNFNLNSSWRSFAGRVIERFSGVELYAIARKP